MQKNHYVFTVSEAAKQNLQDLKNESFNFILFLRDRAVFSEDYEVTTADILFTYQSWCIDNGEQPLKNRSITTYLSNNADSLNIHKTLVANRDGKRVKGYRGFKLDVVQMTTLK